MSKGSDSGFYFFGKEVGRGIRFYHTLVVQNKVHL